jgi:hypothetical protein
MEGNRMGILYKAVNIKRELSKDLQKQDMISQLRSLCVTDCKGQPLESLSYYELRSLLAATKIRIESPENEWF